MDKCDAFVTLDAPLLGPQKINFFLYTIISQQRKLYYKFSKASCLKFYQVTFGNTYSEGMIYFLLVTLLCKQL